MTFTAQAQSLASNGDLAGLERLLDDGAEARQHNRPDMPSTREFNDAYDLRNELKRKGEAA